VQVIYIFIYLFIYLFLIFLRVKPEVVGFMGIRVLPPHEVELSVDPISTKPAADRQLYQM
jgi:hypothetical protein